MANRGTVSNTTVAIPSGFPGLPILNIQEDPRGQATGGFELDLPGPFDIDFRTFGPEQVQPSQDVRTQASGLPMLGPFGVTPQSVQRVTRVCPTGHRLAKDGLCYPKALLAKRSKLRMWPAEPAAPITRADGRALRGHERVEKKLKVLGKRAGLKVSG